MNMFAKNSATSIKEYIDSVPEVRRESIIFLHGLIQKTVPGLKPHFAANMLGYGSFKYLDSKKVPRDWHTVGLANQKNYISVYVCALEGNQYVAEKHKSELGNVSVGKSCISFKKLEDLNLEEFKKVLKAAEKSPGLAGVRLVKD